MDEDLRPNLAEREFLNLAYNSFHDIFEEIFEDSFWNKEAYYRFSKVRDAFAIYVELLNYEPIKYVIEEMKKQRPPMESEIGSELFKFVRNLLAHFPFFNSWDEVWISEVLCNWLKQGQSIDRFLKKYVGYKEIKYRLWEASKKEMTYLSINFPVQYTENTKIYLKDILNETEGIRFSLVLMKQIMDTQINKE
ncbi:hypothetical protein PQ460_12270 [Paenibacillus sp. KACC 21273]|uniref:hypothetical protein n=1 Tax=Paenibacillus sp. KACC 21273 TaxID=3025665 RepID=UPI002366FDA5|nr:hypothetical protein [Paenibacillus sp. KACC 21273]WDF48796.1 hypothetical protein PQ460_12270 [Paenibacillus sp. KACC 21273]